MISNKFSRIPGDKFTIFSEESKAAAKKNLQWPAAGFFFEG
jgi:hypothetical protein